MPPVLELDNLQVRYRSAAGEARAVDGVSFAVRAGQALGLVGESGCGKSTIAKAIMGILPPPARIAGGAIRYQGTDLLTLPDAAFRDLRWREIALVPQSAMNGFDPVYRIEQQMDEAMRAHARMPAARRRARIEALFALVGLERGRLHDYPHQFSGGMRQRAMIAMALVLDPKLVVADEPTTGLDVIVQDQILANIREIHERLHKTMVLITHDMAVVAENCGRVVVMYAGRVMEHGDNEVLREPCHPYTMGLVAAFPDPGDRDRDLVSIPGSPPDLVNPPAGCVFHPRCPFAQAVCAERVPELTEVRPDHHAACHFADRAAELRERARDAAVWAA